MFGICFRSEKDRDLQDQWSYVFSNFGVADLWELGVPLGEKIYQPTTKILTADELPVNRPVVVLAPAEGRYVQGTEDLRTFEHPDDAIYLFGGSHENLSDDQMGSRIADHYVYMDLIEHECYSHCAGYMVLWDRYVKKGKHG